MTAFSYSHYDYRCTTFLFVYINPFKELSFHCRYRLEAKADAKVSHLFLTTKFFRSFFGKNFSMASGGCCAYPFSLPWPCQGKIPGAAEMPSVTTVHFIMSSVFLTALPLESDAKVRTFSVPAILVQRNFQKKNQPLF